MISKILYNASDHDTLYIAVVPASLHSLNFVTACRANEYNF